MIEEISVVHTVGHCAAQNGPDCDESRAHPTSRLRIGGTVHDLPAEFRDDRHRPLCLEPENFFKKPHELRLPLSSV